MTGENPYPNDAAVLVRYPRTKAEEQGDRSAWPWLPGSIVERCGPDEWRACVEAREVAVLEDGSRPPEDVPDDELLFPCCYRDHFELMPRELKGSIGPGRKFNEGHMTRPARLRDYPTGLRYFES